MNQLEHMMRCSDVCKVIWNSPITIYRQMLTSFLNRKSICNPFYYTKYVSISHILLYLPSVSNEGFLPFCLYLIPSTLLKRCWNKSSFYCHNPFNLVSVRRAIGYGKKGISVIDSFHLLLLSTVIYHHTRWLPKYTHERAEREIQRLHHMTSLMMIWSDLRYALYIKKVLFALLINLIGIATDMYE